MRCLDNKVIKIILTFIVIVLSIPISAYIVDAIIGLGRIIGSCIRILGTI